MLAAMGRVSRCRDRARTAGEVGVARIGAGMLGRGGAPPTVAGAPSAPRRDSLPRSRAARRRPPGSTPSREMPSRTCALGRGSRLGRSATERRQRSPIPVCRGRPWMSASLSASSDARVISAKLSPAAKSARRCHLPEQTQNFVSVHGRSHVPGSGSVNGRGRNPGHPVRGSPPVMRHCQHLDLTVNFPIDDRERESSHMDSTNIREVLQPVAMRMLAYVSQHPLELHQIPGAEPGSPALVPGDRL